MCVGGGGGGGRGVEAKVIKKAKIIIVCEQGCIFTSCPWWIDITTIHTSGG